MPKHTQLISTPHDVIGFSKGLIKTMRWCWSDGWGLASFLLYADTFIFSRLFCFSSSLLPHTFFSALFLYPLSFSFLSSLSYHYIALLLHQFISFIYLIFLSLSLSRTEDLSISVGFCDVLYSLAPYHSAKKNQFLSLHFFNVSFSLCLLIL